MRVYFSVLLFVLPLWLPLGSAQSIDSHDDPYAERTIHDALASNGVSFSFTEKAINKLGDRAAIGVIREMAGEPLTTPQQLRSVLSVIRQAFAAPRIIDVDADRQPRATLFLLRSLQDLPISQGLTAEINETKMLVLQSIRPK